MPNQPKPAPGTRGHYISAIPDDLWARARAVAAEQGESISAVVRRALEEYVEGAIMESSQTLTSEQLGTLAAAWGRWWHEVVFSGRLGPSGEWPTRQEYDAEVERLGLRHTKGLDRIVSHAYQHAVRSPLKAMFGRRRGASTCRG